MKDEINEQFDLLTHLANQEAFESKNSLSGRRGTPESGQSEIQAQYSIDQQQDISQQDQHDRANTPQIRPDGAREQRKGAPEIVFGETKETNQIIAMVHGLLQTSGRAIVSRLRPESVEPVRQAFHDQNVRFYEAARAMVISRVDYIQKQTGGHVGLVCAGTSDIPVAEEAMVIAEEMGCRVSAVYDVGVAGLQRLFEPLRNLLNDGVDVIIVAAGMDGALPSVVTGLAPVPVIGLPTSIGYGFGGKGVAALLSMLQTCAPGLAVVNIDNGVGAGITAALIANRVAHARGHQQ